MKRSIPDLPLPFLYLFLCILFLFQPEIALAKTQNIFLSPGWNLISFQLEPENSDPSAVFANLILQNKFRSIWAYDAVTEAWSTWQTGDDTLLNTFTGVVLTQIQSNKGYWINVSDYAELIITGDIVSNPLGFQLGWNLVGFPGFLLQDTDEQDISSILRDKIEGETRKVDEIWTFDPGSGQFKGYDLTVDPKRIDFVTLEPGLGYWVKAREPFTLSAQLRLRLEGDIDVPPLSTADRPFPQPEDEDLNADGYDDTPDTQDTISFRDKMTVNYITIVNRGDSAINWEIQEDIPWLSFDHEYGITTTETDFVSATVNREGMVPGLYTGSLNLLCQNQSRTIRVRMTVPEIDGDYEGLAKVTYVNGKLINIAGVDLSLSLFRDEEGLLRGIIDSEKTLLFPFDVSMSGCYYETGTNRFIVSSSFILPSGPDINNPPFDLFPDANDIDKNGNGKEDVINPFPFDIIREITLYGDRVKEGHLEGTYFEILRGALPEPITMEGFFSLGRKGFNPSKKTPFNYTDTLDRYIPSANVIESLVMVEDHVLIDGIELYLEIEHQSLSDLIITLISPSGQEVILHDQKVGTDLKTVYTSQTTSGTGDHTSQTTSCIGMTGKILKTIPAESLNGFKDEMAQGEWKLRIQDADEDVDGWLREWRLCVQGTPIYQISGRIFDSNTAYGLPKASLTLTGSPVVQSVNTDEEGYYRFNYLSSGHYLITASKPGYETNTIYVWIDKDDITITDPNFCYLSPSLVTEARLFAFPDIGNSSQEVTLVARGTTGALQNGDLCFWDFGDAETYSHTVDAGSIDTDFIEIKHQYTSAGSYTATLRITDATTTNEKVHITTPDAILIYPVYGEPDPGPYIFQWTFSGGGSDFAIHDKAYYQEQEAAADTASFDVDRPPYRTASDFPGPEDTDYTDDHDKPTDGVYTIYTPDPVKGHTAFRIISNIGSQLTGTCVAKDKRLYIGPSGLL